MSAVKAEMAGTVLEYKVVVGDRVKPGQEIVILESMKMEVSVPSQIAGTVICLAKSPGDFVNEGEVLVDLQ